MRQQTAVAKGTRRPCRACRSKQGVSNLRDVGRTVRSRPADLTCLISLYCQRRRPSQEQISIGGYLQVLVQWGHYPDSSLPCDHLTFWAQGGSFTRHPPGGDQKLSQHLRLSSENCIWFCLESQEDGPPPKQIMDSWLLLDYLVSVKQHSRYYSQRKKNVLHKCDFYSKSSLGL